jgi:hypothetical protein
MSVAHVWGSTEGERHRSYACDLASMPEKSVELFRAVDVAAPGEVTFRRLCHMRLAPYSYDLVDNGGRRSPRALTPGVENLEAGQRFMRIFTLESFVRGEHLTLRLTSPRARKMFADIVITYAILPTSPATCRLLAKVRCGPADRVDQRIRIELLAWGDLLMMRKQLLTLGHLAHLDAQRQG